MIGDAGRKKRQSGCGKGRTGCGVSRGAYAVAAVGGGQAAEEKAQGLVEQALRKLGWKGSDLTKFPKGDPKKVKIALRLRRETTMTLAWLAERLRMGTKTHLAHLLYWHDRE